MVETGPYQFNKKNKTKTLPDFARAEYAYHVQYRIHCIVRKMIRTVRRFPNLKISFLIEYRFTKTLEIFNKFHRLSKT